jgi:hypothetical protein
VAAVLLRTDNPLPPYDPTLHCSQREYAHDLVTDTVASVALNWTCGEMPHPAIMIRAWDHVIESMSEVYA